ncbi:MAG: DUF424 family protein [Candidatus Woesearchaeota archaeon]
MIVKVHKRESRTVVAVCDSDLLGRKFEENGRQLDLTSDFYKGEERDEKEVGDIIRNADIVNLVGQNAVKLGLQEEVITQDHVITIAGIPHAQAVITHE